MYYYKIIGKLKTIARVGFIKDLYIMKKILFAVVMLLSLSSMTYASFPVTNQPSEQSIKESTVENSILTDLGLSNLLPVAGGGSGFSIAALCCGILGFFFLPFLLGPLAIIFGVLGLKRDGRGMAIAGLVLGILQVLLVLLAVLFIAALAGSYGV